MVEPSESKEIMVRWVRAVASAMHAPGSSSKSAVIVGSLNCRSGIKKVDGLLY